MSTIIFHFSELLTFPWQFVYLLDIARYNKCCCHKCSAGLVQRKLWAFPQFPRYNNSCCNECGRAPSAKGDEPKSQKNQTGRTKRKGHGEKRSTFRSGGAAQNRRVTQILGTFNPYILPGIIPKSTLYLLMAIEISLLVPNSFLIGFEYFESTYAGEAYEFDINLLFFRVTIMW